MLILPEAPKRHDFQTIWRLGAKKKKKGKFEVTFWKFAVLSQEVLAFCTKDSAGLATPLFSLALAAKAGRATGWSCGAVSASSCCTSDKVKGW